MENLHKTVCDSIFIKLFYPQEVKNPEEIISASEISTSSGSEKKSKPLQLKSV